MDWQTRFEIMQPRVVLKIMRQNWPSEDLLPLPNTGHFILLCPHPHPALDLGCKHYYRNSSSLLRLP